MGYLKLQTPVDAGTSAVTVSYADRITVLGSCFADHVGRRLVEAGFDACVNPFGALYNPVSLCNAAARLSAGVPFTHEDCVRMGAGSDLWCSFCHHTSFARETPEAFLENANRCLEEASAFWKESGKVLVTLGTAWYFTRKDNGETVSNCLKIDARTFDRRRLTHGEAAAMLSSMVRRHPEKQFIFTVSPVRHPGDGAHGNQLSKSVLLLAAEQVCTEYPERCAYFPAYEIVLDELRDYRFYAEDMVHPSAQTAAYIWRRFMDFAMGEADRERALETERKLLREKHIPMH